MKKTLFVLVVMAVIVGMSMVGFAQTQGKMGGQNKGMMRAQGQGMMRCRPMGPGMHMGGIKMIATEDGGIVVMSLGKLYKYDKDLKLIKEIDIPMDFEHMKKMRMKMKEMWMSGNTQGESEGSEQ